MNWIKESLHKLLPLSFNWELYKSKMPQYYYTEADYSFNEIRILNYLGKAYNHLPDFLKRPKEDHNWDKEYRPKPRQMGGTDFVVDQILGQIKEKIFPQPNPIPNYGTPAYLQGRAGGYRRSEFISSGNKTIDFPFLYGMSNQRLSDHITALDFETQVSDLAKFYKPYREFEPVEPFKNMWDKAYPRLSIDPVTKPIIVSSIGNDRMIYDMWMRAPINTEHFPSRVSWEPGFNHGKLFEYSMVLNPGLDIPALAESLKWAILKMKNKAEGDYPDW